MVAQGARQVVVQLFHEADFITSIITAFCDSFGRCPLVSLTLISSSCFHYSVTKMVAQGARQVAVQLLHEADFLRAFCGGGGPTQHQAPHHTKPQVWGQEYP